MIYPYLDGEPIVPLDMKGGGRVWYEFHAYVDSGAAFSIFHVDVAEVLKIKVRGGRKLFFTVGDGTQIPGYVHVISVKLAGKKFEAEIAFSQSLGVGVNLLGLKSFFDNFRICFNNSRGCLEVKPFIRSSGN